MSKPRAIIELLATQFSGEFEQTIQRSEKLRQLWHRLRRKLDADLASHCQLQNLRDGMLIIACDSTAWATRLRYQIPTLLEAMHHIMGHEGIHDIQIRVQPVSQKTQQQSARATLSSHGAHCLKQCADTISDPALRQALEQLAKRQCNSGES